MDIPVQKCYGSLKLDTEPISGTCGIVGKLGWGIFGVSGGLRHNHTSVRTSNKPKETLFDKTEH